MGVGGLQALRPSPAGLPGPPANLGTPVLGTSEEGRGGGGGVRTPATRDVWVSEAVRRGVGPLVVTKNVESECSSGAKGIFLPLVYLSLSFPNSLYLLPM